jgi:hypothetical protein
VCVCVCARARDCNDALHRSIKASYAVCQHSIQASALICMYVLVLILRRPSHGLRVSSDGEELLWSQRVSSPRYRLSKHLFLIASLAGDLPAGRRQGQESYGCHRLPAIPARCMPGRCMCHGASSMTHTVAHVFTCFEKAVVNKSFCCVRGACQARARDLRT